MIETTALSNGEVQARAIAMVQANILGVDDAVARAVVLVEAALLRKPSDDR
jgi:hypothetical protein